MSHRGYTTKGSDRLLFAKMDEFSYSSVTAVAGPRELSSLSHLFYDYPD